MAFCKVTGVMRSLTKNPQAVVNGYDDNIPVASQDAPVDHVARTLHVRSAVDVHHHRLLTVLIMDVWKKNQVRKYSKESY